MSSFVTLAEAASYLGVSKATLRNWDREGKLKAYRHPLNHYRTYDLNELRTLRPQTLLFDESPVVPTKTNTTGVADPRSIKRIVSRLHTILRNTDGDSSILGRFDELTKLLFLNLVADRGGDRLFDPRPNEDPRVYAFRIRDAYVSQAARHPKIIPEHYSLLKCSDNAIYQCGAVLSTLSFSGMSVDVNGVAYEEIIRGTFDKSDHQQFFTPHQIVSLMTTMLRPFLKGVVADPACGTAGFLTGVVQSGSLYDRLIGLEIDERLAWVSAINLLLHGAASFETHCLGEGGALGPLVTEYLEKVDAILTNPPFGSDFADAVILQTFELGKGRSSRRRGILFIERCWSLLKDGGVLGIVIDEGVLNLPTATDVRSFILDHFDILAIISLPESAFMPYATVNSSVLFLRKSSRRCSQRVFFGKAENIGRKPNGDDDVIYDDMGNASLKSDLPQIIQHWEAVLAGQDIEVDDLAFVANVAENLAKDDSLRLDFRYHHPSRNRSRELLNHSRQNLYTLADLCEERNETMIPSTEMADQVILYTGLANIEAGTGVAHQVPTPAASLKSAVKRYESNDILFARMRPNLRKVALMSFSEGGYASPECSVLSVRRDAEGHYIVQPEILATLLRSDLVFGQIMHLIAGIGRPRLNIADLRKVRVPVPSYIAQQECKAKFGGRVASARQLRAKAQLLLAEAQELELAAVSELADQMISG